MTKTESTTLPASVPPAAKPVPAKTRVTTARKTPAKRAPAAKKVVVKPALAVKKLAKPATAKVIAAKPVAKPDTSVDAKATKEKKHKLVRDSITVPKAEYLVLEAMKHRAAQLKVMVKKTELIRAGMKHLATLPDDAFLAAIAAVPSLKTGRPSKD